VDTVCETDRISVALKGLHLLSPRLILSYYLIASFVATFRPHLGQQNRAATVSGHATAIILTTWVMLTYVSTIHLPGTPERHHNFR
jgi:hypothetical protein